MDFFDKLKINFGVFLNFVEKVWEVMIVIYYKFMIVYFFCRGVWL